MFKFRMMTKAAMALAAALIVLSPIQSTYAQEAAPAPAASIPVAIGIVNVQEVVKKSTAGQSLKKQADARRKQNQTELLAEEKKLRAENDQLNAQRATLSPADFGAKQQAFQQKLNAWRQGAEQKQKAFESSYNKAQKTIFETLQKVIGDIAVQKRLTLVLNKSVVIVSAQAWDISDSALAQLNKVLPAVKM
ncbi:OmpH family outer membrane protein [Dongia sp.]|uniref:OmpH family outer membrane protein n=1 Tax=Dongia sp. TaxID=1977262 RepID=UPI0035ADD9A8